MPKSSGAFTGIKLTEPLTPPEIKLDQQLFSPNPLKLSPKSKVIGGIKEAKKLPPQSKESTTLPRYHGTMAPPYQQDLIETIRHAVKELGKEAATYRFTQKEKKTLSDIVYTYKGRGVKTSENEVTRISVNFLIEDYSQNGQNSILAQVLKKLND